jgi:hypothetical protein
VCDDHRVRLGDMTLDDLVSWGWSTALALTGIVLIYWVDVIAGGLLLVVGLAGMHAVRVRFGWRTRTGHSWSSSARSTTVARSSGD